MRSLAYKHLIWNSTWYKKYSRPLTAAGQAEHEKPAGLGAAVKKRTRKFVRWLHRLNHTVH